MSKIQTNLLGRIALVDPKQGPFPDSSPLAARAKQRGEIVTVERIDAKLYLGVLWPDGQITSWPAKWYNVGIGGL